MLNLVSGYKRRASVHASVSESAVKLKNHYPFYVYGNIAIEPENFVYGTIEKIKANLRTHGARSFSIKGEKNGLVALQLAIRNRRFEVAELLISEGAPLTCSDKSGHALLHESARVGYMEGVVLIHDNDLSDSFNIVSAAAIHFSERVLF